VSLLLSSKKAPGGVLINLNRYKTINTALLETDLVHSHLDNYSYYQGATMVEANFNKALPRRSVEVRGTPADNYYFHNAHNSSSFNTFDRSSIHRASPVANRSLHSTLRQRNSSMDSHPEFASTGGATMSLARLMSRLPPCRSCVKIIATTLLCLSISYSRVPVGRENKFMGKSQNLSLSAHNFRSEGSKLQAEKDFGRARTGSGSASDITPSGGDVWNSIESMDEDEDTSKTIISSVGKNRKRPNIAFAKRRLPTVHRVAGRPDMYHNIQKTTGWSSSNINERLHSIFSQEEPNFFAQSEFSDLHGLFVGFSILLCFTLVVFLVGYSFSTVRWQRQRGGRLNTIVI